MLGASGREHLQIALGEAVGRALVARVERIHQAIAEGIGVDVERGMYEVRDVGPERLIARLELDRLSETLPLHLEPERVEALDGDLAAAAFHMDVTFEGIERDLTHHPVDHVLDLT